MASLKDLRNRIASVKATQKITKAMQMVAAAKLRRAQAAAEAARPYAQRMNKVLANVSAGAAGNPSASPLLVGTGRDQTHLLVVCTAERGLCGAFNASIARLARDKARALIAEGKTVKIICVGKKGNDLLKRQFDSMIIDFIDLRHLKSIGFVDAIGQKILSLVHAGQFDVCSLVFSRFRSVIAQVPTELQLIPAQIATGDHAVGSSYSYEPDEEEILSTLLPCNISTQVYSALLENAASEQGARMSAMDNATRNAGEMIKKQTMQYNRTRQAMITKELIEIISGAEAL